jgi:hypothetical protein
MRFLIILASIVSVGFGVLLCVPAGWLLGNHLSLRHRARHTSLTDLASGVESQHTDLVIPVAGMQFYGWRLWVLVCGLALLGILLALGAIYVLFLR